MNTFGENLKKFRNSLGLTQSQFGEEVQLSRSQINNLENNFNEPDLASLNRIANFFDVSVDTLMGRKTTTSEKHLENVLDELQTVFAGLDEVQREHLSKQLILYLRFLNANQELL
ncbi:helix-turn-helix domain-containing protein [Bacillus sp. CGMCC 1.60114]|uniref:helix-turn-helix domain-containing protein n=1 Tax=unclassified Bacillus (in: firmicutes) TaxID=185979 RepID=UPI00363ED19C